MAGPIASIRLKRTRSGLQDWALFLLADRSGHPHSIGMAELSTGIAEFTMGRWQSARERLEQAEGILRSRCTGVAWELDTGHAFELWARIYAGDFTHMTRRSTAKR